MGATTAVPAALAPLYLLVVEFLVREMRAEHGS